MKKTTKTAKPKNSGTKTRKNTTKTANSRKKHSKTGSVFFQAIKLSAMLAAISILISSVFILIQSNMEKPQTEIIAENELPVSVIVETEHDTNKPASIQQPPEKNTTVNAPVRTQPEISNTPAPVSTTSSKPVNTAPQVSGNTTANTVRPAAAAQKPVENLGSLVFVIDDAGNNLRELEPFLGIPGPLTIAVLPGLPFSAEAARRIRAAGKEVILHQPMEAIGAQDPGPGAIYSGMSADEIRAILKRNIMEVGPVAGMNNHQGSKITMDEEAMKTILAFCAENGIFFLDSRTTAETVVPQTARQMGIKIGQRDVFIDNEQDKDSMIRYITGGLERARKNGSAVMIGHTWSPELAPLLAQQFPVFSNQGYTLKTVSDIIK